MTRLSVVFLPENKTAAVAEGATIADAARKAGVFINNLCGGQGVCGRCRVRVLKGTVHSEPHARAFFSPRELAEGYVLACQSPVHESLEVMIPPESRMEVSQILGEDTVAAPSPQGLNPLVRKFFLRLPAPSPEDNVSDMDRISRELRKALGWHSYEVSLRCIQNLSDRLRDNDWEVTVTVAKHRSGYRILRVEGGNTVSENYGAAVDVGTTTVVAQLVNIHTGEVLGTRGTQNSQATYGEDVISRMVFACTKDGLPPLHEAVIANINELVSGLAAEADVPVNRIVAMVASGNTTMSHFLLNLTPCSIRLDPYVPTVDVYPQIFARDINIRIHPGGILETLPSVASYVGGDIVGGIMSCGITDHPEVRGIIDIGTNGEIALGNSEWLICCSASAGPAFEGGGTRCGMRATTGAIEKISVKNGQWRYQTIGHAPPRGLCGSGLIDCVYEMVVNGIIGPDGKFQKHLRDDRLTEVDGNLRYTICPPQETEAGEPIFVTEADIGNLIKSKGAVFAAMKSLMDYVGLHLDQIESLYVAGGFGNYLDTEKAVSIGLLPDMAREKILFIGNSSLTGARMGLLSEAALEKCLNISRSMTNIELSSYLPYMDEYIAALFLPHTERRLFPSVTY